MKKSLILMIIAIILAGCHKKSGHLVPDESNAKEKTVVVENRIYVMSGRTAKLSVYAYRFREINSHKYYERTISNYFPHNVGDTITIKVW